MSALPISDLAERFEAMHALARQAVAEMATIKATTDPMTDEECEEYLESTGFRRLLTAIEELGALFGVPNLGDRLL